MMCGPCARSPQSRGAPEPEESGAVFLSFSTLPSGFGVFFLRLALGLGNLERERGNRKVILREEADPPFISCFPDPFSPVPERTSTCPSSGHRTLWGGSHPDAGRGEGLVMGPALQHASYFRFFCSIHQVPSFHVFCPFSPSFSFSFHLFTSSPAHFPFFLLVPPPSPVESFFLLFTPLPFSLTRALKRVRAAGGLRGLAHTLSLLRRMILGTFLNLPVSHSLHP